MGVKRRAGAVLALVVICAVVAGCGATSSSTSHTAATATAPASATPQSTVDPAVLARCYSEQSASSDITQFTIQSGDMLITKPLSSLSYPAVRVPDQTPLKPLQVPADISNNAYSASPFAGTTPVNPGILTGATREISLIALLCNGSTSQSQVVRSVSARIAGLTPFAGQVMIWPSCDGAFSRLHPDPITGGCGGGYATEEQVQATFASGAQAGATVAATQTGFGDTSPGEGVTALPFTLGAGKAMAFEVTLDVTDMVGTYTFSIGFQIDNAAAAFGPATDALLAAPVSHTFTGVACTTPTMLAQIPAATIPETFFVCPQ